MSTTTEGGDDEDPPPPPPPLGPPPARSKSWSEDDIDDDSSSNNVPSQQHQQNNISRVRTYDSPAYVSSASSNEPPTPTRIKKGIEIVPEKIAAAATPPLIVHRKSSSGDDIFVPQPNHQFVQSFYDSDGSDGSLVFSYPRGTTPPATYDFMRNHERWGSMDSLNSNSPKPLHQQQRTPTPPKQHPQPRLTSPQNVFNSYNPQVLPYHQRRKLLQQRQQQEQRQRKGTAGSSNSGSTLQPFPEEGQMDPGAAAAFAGSTQFHGQQHHHPRRSQSPSPTGGLRPITETSPPPTYHARRPVPLDTISAGGARTPKQSPLHPPPAPPPPLPHPYSLPPSGHSRSFSGSGSFVNNTPRSRLNSVDSNTSSDSAAGGRRRYDHPQQQHYMPPPPPPYSHIRTESSGSVSSLGSGSDQAGGAPAAKDSLTDRLDQDIAGYLREQEQRRSSYALPPPPPPPQQQQRQHPQHRQEHRRSNGGGSGFLLGLFNLSPRQQQHHTTPNIEEYHQRNQAFLQRAERQRAKLRQQQLPFPQRRPPVNTSPRPPNSRGVHRQGLSSIDNDNWEDEQELPGRKARSAAILVEDQKQRQRAETGPLTSFVSSSQEEDETDDEASSSGMVGSSSNQDMEESDEATTNERTSLLPPSGISTREGEQEFAGGYTDTRGGRRRNDALEQTVRWDNRQAAMLAKKSKGRGKNRRKNKRKDKGRGRRHRHVHEDDSDDDEVSYSSSSSSEYDHKRWAKKRAKMFEKERTKLIAQWKAEARAEAEAARKLEEANRWHRRLGRWVEAECTNVVDVALKFLATAETFICNLPLTIGAIALAIVTLGVVWFKFAEENLDSCEPVHFHSSQCTFPEFPGCFYCDTHTRLYKLAVNFHFCCSAIAGVLAMGFMAKVILATRVVLDEMSSPTTSSPAGLICMTTVCVFAGRGWIGQMLVSAAATLHLGLVIWFIYMALAYHIMPEPSWYPNTVGVGLSAVKTWLYYPMPGHFLMAISLSLNFFFFPISLIRVTLNEKMSAPVCWIQMSAPAVSLYALTIMAQPSFEEEHPDVTRFQRVHRMVYLPCMHFLFVLAVIGLASSVQSLATRWEKFRDKEFSPAHAAFCFPMLAHANAIQAYRAAVDAFSNIPPGSPFKIALYTYWVIVLVSGTVSTLVITAKFFYHLPSWTQVDVADEEEPPAPNETTLRDVIAAGETLRQPFVSPAVLQANETGALVFLRRGGEDGRGRYVRTRRLPALGFEPTMNWSEMNAERDVLLDWVAKNPPRRRKKTLSVPGIDFNYGFGDFGTGNSGVYGLEGAEAGHGRAFSHIPRRERSNTFDNSYRQMRGGYY